ncbi:MAG: F-box domain protein [Barrevirus sp.]|uniref:F-box domain protein n=1 Tax=Barrevirus sp. TaxID=2487763 RepID=A0A3G4ZT74_9VIRU|nr:MAG: F-box domain protein [Barrevirus sp.]
MNTLLPDIISIIFQNFDTKQLIWSQRTCKKWRKVYIDNMWKYFINLEQWAGEIKDKHLESFRNAKTISLKHCEKIKGPGLVYLENATVIDLSYCRIENIHLRFLKSVKILNLVSCGFINGNGLKYIATNIEHINLFGCGAVTIESLNYLINAKSIIICRCFFPMELHEVIKNCNNIVFCICPLYTFEQLQSFKEKYPNITIINKNY